MKRQQEQADEDEETKGHEYQAKDGDQGNPSE